MLTNVRVLRKQISENYYLSFSYEGEGSDSVAKVLTIYNDEVNAGIRDGEPIFWECSCMVRRCGACAMRINGVPRLACSAFLREFEGEDIVLEPLSKFPHVRDLITDRQKVFDSLRELNIWLDENAVQKKENHPFRFASAKCISCGCCLEVCPNFNYKKNYTGVIAAVNGYRIAANEKPSKEKRGKYVKNYYEGCGLSLSCHDICPAGIPVDELLARSNAAFVWGKRNI